VRGIAIALLVGWLAAWPSATLAADGSGLTPDALQALADPGLVTLYSLEPTIRPAPPANAFHHIAVLGQAVLDPAEARKAITAFRAAVAEADREERAWPGHCGRLF
jgi:hypothetical protein